jgi:hypothetical protein
MFSCPPLEEIKIKKQREREREGGKKGVEKRPRLESKSQAKQTSPMVRFSSLGQRASHPSRLGSL